jgi:hypothetical protein
VLAAVVRKHYNPIENPQGVDGAQMRNGQWWMPLWGCDTLDNMLDDIAYAIEHQQASNACVGSQLAELKRTADKAWERDRALTERLNALRSERDANRRIALEMTREYEAERESATDPGERRRAQSVARNPLNNRHD